MDCACGRAHACTVMRKGGSTDLAFTRLHTKDLDILGQELRDHFGVVPVREVPAKVQLERLDRVHVGKKHEALLRLCIHLGRLSIIGTSGLLLALLRRCGSGK